jgi:hypothetical protein
MAFEKSRSKERGLKPKLSDEHTEDVLLLTSDPLSRLWIYESMIFSDILGLP